MPTILITGGTGLVGTALTQLLVNKGYEVIILTRSLEGQKPGNTLITYAEWNVKKQVIDEQAVAKADFIVHLAGAGVADKRWSEDRKAEIRDSRVQSGNLLVKALNQTPNKVKAVISSSAIGWYGSDDRLPKNRKSFTEDMPADDSFLGDTCQLWEASMAPVAQMGKRLVTIRTGIVLSNAGGAFVQFKLPVKFGVAAILGYGGQVISWIHINDLCNIFLHAIENDTISGPYNAVAPHPISNKKFTRILAQKMRGSFFIPIHVPAFVLKTMLGQMSIEVLKSATVSSKKIEQTGVTFQFATAGEAISALCK